jgi:hypothetical protein
MSIALTNLRPWQQKPGIFKILGFLGLGFEDVYISEGYVTND